VDKADEPGVDGSARVALDPLEDADGQLLARPLGEQVEMQRHVAASPGERRHPAAYLKHGHARQAVVGEVKLAAFRALGDAVDAHLGAAVHFEPLEALEEGRVDAYLHQRRKWIDHGVAQGLGDLEAAAVRPEVWARLAPRGHDHAAGVERLAVHAGASQGALLAVNGLDLRVAHHLHAQFGHLEPEHVEHVGRLVGEGEHFAVGLDAGGQPEALEEVARGRHVEAVQDGCDEVGIAAVIPGRVEVRVGQVAPAVARNEQLLAHPRHALDQANPGAAPGRHDGGGHPGRAAADDEQVGGVRHETEAAARYMATTFSPGISARMLWIPLNTKPPSWRR